MHTLLAQRRLLGASKHPFGPGRDSKKGDRIEKPNLLFSATHPSARQLDPSFPPLAFPPSPFKDSSTRQIVSPFLCIRSSQSSDATTRKAPCRSVRPRLSSHHRRTPDAAAMRWLTSLAGYVAPIFLILSPVLSYSDQAMSMHRNKSSAGFSLDIPLIMLIASMFRYAASEQSR